MVFYKARKKASVLVLTLLIVTLMSAATLGAAVNSYSIVADSNAYNDARVARDAAMAGVADLSHRLKDPTSTYKDDPTTVLYNFSTESDVTTTKNKAPFYKYYSFTPQERIQTLSRCTNVASISAWDASLGSYSYPSNVFTGVNADEMKKSEIIQRNKFKAFDNPMTEKLPNGTPKYKPTEVDYWKVYMGGPKDRGIVLGDHSTSMPKEAYEGLFSKSQGYLKLDLIVMNLPTKIVFDDHTRDNLESFLINGGKLMIEGASIGIVNAPFSNTSSPNYLKYRFLSEGMKNFNDPGDKGINAIDYKFDEYQMNNQLWLNEDAYNSSQLKWSKPNITATAKQTINGQYAVRQVYKDSTPRAFSNPSSKYLLGGGSWTDTFFDDANRGKVILSYGDPSVFGIGDRVELFTMQGVMNPGQDEHSDWNSKYANQTITISGTVIAINSAEKWLQVDTTKLWGKIGFGSWASWSYNRVRKLCKDLTDEGEAAAGSVFRRQDEGFPIRYANISKWEYFSNKMNDCQYPGDPDNTIIRTDYGKILGITQSNLECIWGNGNAPITIGTNILIPVDNTDGYTVNSIVQIDPFTAGQEPLWGKITAINYGSSIVADLSYGPMPRKNHSIIKGSGNIIYLFGGETLANRFINGNVTENRWNIARGTDSMDFSIDPASANDVWKLEKNGSGDYQWELIRPSNPPDGLPLPRYNALTVYDTVNDNIIVTGGTAGGEGDDKGLSVVNSMADVWKLNITNPNPVWTNIIDRGLAALQTLGNTDINGNGSFISEVYAHKKFETSVSSSAGYYVEQPAGINEVTLNVPNWAKSFSPTGAVGMPRGLAVGDTIRISSYKQTAADNTYTNLTGKIASFTYLNDDGARSKYTLKFTENLSGVNTENDPTVKFGITIADECNDVSNSVPNENELGAKCFSAQDMVFYHGIDIAMDQTDSEDMVYWGRVKYVGDNNPLPLQSKSFYQIYRGPFFMDNPKGFYDSGTGTLYVHGGYDHNGEQPTWKLEGVNTNDPKWRYLKPTGVAAGADFQVYRSGTFIGSNNTIVTTGSDNIIDEVGFDTSLSLKILSGSDKNMVIGGQYSISPADGLTATGKIIGTFVGVEHEGDGDWIQFKNADPEGGNEANFINNANNGLIVRYNGNTFAEDRFDVPAASVIIDPETETPTAIRIGEAEAQGMYVGKMLTLSPKISPANKALGAQIDKIDYEGNGLYNVYLRARTTYAPTYKTNTSLTSNGTNKLYYFDTNKGEIQIWEGLLEGGNKNINWKFTNNASSGPRPSGSYSRNTHLFHGGSVYTWGGYPAYHYLWKLVPDTANANVWTSVKNNPNNEIGSQRPFSLIGSEPVELDGKDLLYFGGSYKLTYNKLKRDNSLPLKTPAGVDEILSPLATTDGTSVNFRHPVLSSIYDRINQDNDIFRMDRTDTKDILDIINGGAGITDWGNGLQQITSYPCKRSEGQIEDETVYKSNGAYCSLSSTLMGEVGNSGGLLYITASSMDYYNIGGQMKLLDVMNRAMQHPAPAGYDLSQQINYWDYNFSTNDFFEGIQADAGTGSTDGVDNYNSFDWFDAIAYAFFDGINYDLTNPESPFEKFYHHYYWDDFLGEHGDYTKTREQVKEEWVQYLYPGKVQYMRGAIFYLNLISYMQTYNKIKVTGYYGGVARAFLVSYYPSGTIAAIEEVPAEE